MKRLLLILITTLGLSSCGTENLEKGANIIASTFKSEKVNVGKSFTADTQKGKIKSLTVELEGVEAIEKDNYPLNKVASISAKLLVDNLKKEDIGEAEIVSVKIKNKEQTSEFKYSIADLIRIDSFLKIAKLYLEDIKNRNYDKLVNYIDTTRLSMTDHLSMINTYKQNDSIMGQQDNITITGFNYTTVKAETDLQVVETWAEMTAKEHFNRYHFYLNNDGKEIKILAVAIND